MSYPRKPSIPPPIVSGTPPIADKFLNSRWSDQSLGADVDKRKRSVSQKAASVRSKSNAVDTKKDAPADSGPIVNISHSQNISVDGALADELDYITVNTPNNIIPQTTSTALSHIPRADKASRILGINHRKSMEPIPASTRTSIVSTRSAREAPPIASFTPTLPLTSLYVVSGLPKSPHTWTLADPDSVLGLHHSDSAVNRWWRPEVLGSTVSPGAGGGQKKKKKNGKHEEIMKGAGALSKPEVGKMLSKALKLSFTREVEIIASTLQPASTIHTFTFNLPAPNAPLAPTSQADLLRASVMSGTDIRSSAGTFAYPYLNDDPYSRPNASAQFLGLSSSVGHGNASGGPSNSAVANGDGHGGPNGNVTYHGVCLTVWSHADAERSAAIRRTLEAARSRKESAQSVLASRLKSLRGEAGGLMGSKSDIGDPTTQARRRSKKSSRGPWTDADTDGETEGEGGLSESEYEVASTAGGHGPGESTLFLPGDTVFWLPYALTLVSRHPIYDLMRDYLTLSWARFSKDVQSHTLQISKILSHPAPRAGDLVRLDASAKDETNLEVVARFPGGLDFGRGLVDINFTMWPLFKCLNIDNILTICEIALAPTGRVVFFSRHPAMLGIAVATIKYLVELRGWNGIALSAVHSRDAKIYIDDPGPWIIGLATEARYSIRPSSEVCIVDLDINYLSCPAPPPGVVSVKKQRELYRQRLLAAFEPHYHPDHGVPSEFKEAFPAGRFRPVCKIQTKRGASSAAVADTIKAPEWWHSTRIIQAFDSVLQDKMKKPSFLRRISSLGAAKRPPQLTVAEQLIQLSIRKRATAFVDARDDLETKIGRLSRRLNFLMTESDLWRDKFVTFEAYAERLSGEANQLRTKINKEQRETKRLSGLVTMTATEKIKLQTQLHETENAHQDAVMELRQMRENMERMEDERAEMMAEVEAQIERALASMAVDVDMDMESEYSDYSRPSRPSSRTSSHAFPRSRRASDASKARLPSIGTESTLAESYHERDIQDDGHTGAVNRETDTIDEEEEPAPSPTKKKRFSATRQETQDNMTAMDEGISQKSDNIAQKVLQIQQKLDAAFASDSNSSVEAWKNQVESQENEVDSEEAIPIRTRPTKGSKLINNPPKARKRSGTGSSVQTNRSTPRPSADLTASPQTPLQHIPTIPSESGNKTPTGASSEDERDLRKSPSDMSLNGGRPTSPPTPMKRAPQSAVSVTTDDSDADFQSAYSRSSRGSTGSLGSRSSRGWSSDAEENSNTFAKRSEQLGAIKTGGFKRAAPEFPNKARSRLSSTATAVYPQAHPSPTLSVATVGLDRKRELSENTP